MTVTVVDESGTPLGDAAVTVAANNYSGTPGVNYPVVYKREYRTDEQGEVDISFDGLAEKHIFQVLLIEAARDAASLPIVVFYQVDTLEPFGESRGNDSQITVPDKLTAVLRTNPKKLECRVVDEQGKGIAGVRAVLSPANTTTHVGMTRFGGEVTQETDAEGRLQITVGDDISWKHFSAMSLTHDDFEPFVGTRAWLESPKSPTTQIVLKAKPLISARVVDENDQPVAGATVRFVRRTNQASTINNARSTLSFSEYEPVAVDADGRFSFGYSAAERSLLIVVTASGKRSQLIGITSDTVNPDELLEIKMSPGSTIRIRAVDEKGEIVPDMEVQPAFIVNYDLSRSTTSFFAFRGVRMDIPAPTGGIFLDDGTWEWSDADREEYYLRVVARDEEGKITHQCEEDYYRLRPREEPYVVKMRKLSDDAQPFAWPLTSKIMIRVTDYDTGEPCPGVKVALNMYRHPASPTANAVFPVVIKDYLTNEGGEIALDFSRVLATNPTDVIGFAFQSDGYADKSFRWDYNANVFRVLNPRHLAVEPLYNTMSVRRSEGPQTGMPIPGLLEISLVRMDAEGE